MMYSEENIFGLEDPNAYYCIATHYRRGHSQLFVRVIPHAPSHFKTFYLTFQGVEYIEGAFIWGNANFCIATDDECKRFLVDRGLDTDICKACRLFIVNHAGFKTKIIAFRNVDKSNDPGDFSLLFNTPIRV